MVVANPDANADYAALRSDLMDVLSEQSAQGRFAWMTDASDEAQTTRFLLDLARTIADILITAYPKRDSEAYAAVLADAVVLARGVLNSKVLNKAPNH